MKYKAFHQNDKNIQGGTFSIFEEIYKNNDSITWDYCHIKRLKKIVSVQFLNSGKEFEFCGLGSLCIADYLLKEDRSNLKVSHSTFPFEIFKDEGISKVMIKNQNNYKKSSLFGKEAYLFEKQRFYLVLSQIEEIESFKLTKEQISHLKNEGISFAILGMNALDLYFRYFTAFKDSIEDDATGSIFRYLKPLDLKNDTTYNVLQMSQTKAKMKCYFKNDKIVFWGEVEKYD